MTPSAVGRMHESLPCWCSNVLNKSRSADRSDIALFFRTLASFALFLFDAQVFGTWRPTVCGVAGPPYASLDAFLHVSFRLGSPSATSRKHGQPKPKQEPMPHTTPKKKRKEQTHTFELPLRLVAAFILQQRSQIHNSITQPSSEAFWTGAQL